MSYCLIVWCTEKKNVQPVTALLCFRRLPLVLGNVSQPLERPNVHIISSKPGAITCSLRIVSVSPGHYGSLWLACSLISIESCPGRIEPIRIRKSTTGEALWIHFNSQGLELREARNSAELAENLHACIYPEGAFQLLSRSTEGADAPWHDGSLKLDNVRNALACQYP